MKSSLLIATLVVAGAGIIGATVGATGAGIVQLNGSDTLGPLTVAVISAPGSSWNNGQQISTATNNLNYNGGGSGTGQSNMISGIQDIAPMSSMLSSGICTVAPAVGSTTTAHGCVIGLDGVGVWASSDNAQNTTCNGAPVAPFAADTSCSGGTTAGVDTTTGLDINRDLTTACGIHLGTNAGWRDILKILYYGKDQTGAIHCDSNVRLCLANSYGAVFENANCSAVGPGDVTTAGSPHCTQIRHLFRRDDASGTTDVFGALLGFGGPSVLKGGVQIPATMATKNNTKQYWMGSDSFCNNAANFTASPESTEFAPTPTGLNPGVEAATDKTLFTPYVNYVANDMMDRDPIRRECWTSGGGEQVCEGPTYDPTATCSATGTTGATQCNTSSVNGVCSQTKDCQCLNNQCWNKKGTLGLVLPIVTMTTLGTQATPEQFNTQPCTSFTQIKAPVTYNGTQYLSMNCPSGDANTNGSCFVPADANGNPNCLADLSTTNAPATGSAQGGYNATNGDWEDTGKGPTPNSASPLVYNLFIYAKNSSNQWQYALDETGRPVAGDAFHRIHSTQTLSTNPLVVPCQQGNETNQIGCLVGASPCSLGYAGRGAYGLLSYSAGGTTTTQTGTQFQMTSLRVNGVPSTDTCIDYFEYPYTRKLYLNSIVGMGTLTANTGEWYLAQDECTSAAQNVATMTSLMTNNQIGPFVPIPSWVNGGNPFCEDFNEQMLCSASTNANACTAVQSAGYATGLTTTCGNGVLEFGEDCDPGLPLPSTSCSNTCRFLQ